MDAEVEVEFDILRGRKSMSHRRLYVTKIALNIGQFANLGCPILRANLAKAGTVGKPSVVIWRLL